MSISDLLLYISLFASLFFEIFLLITYFEIRAELALEREGASKEPDEYPSATIIVPCYNEERTVLGTIESLLNLDYPKEKLSLIVVDDGSTDSTRAVVEKRFGSHQQVSIYSKENGGKHTALNFALKKIESELVGCLDADSFVEPDALKRIIPYFSDEKVMAVTPAIKIHEPQTVLQHVQRVEYSWGIFLRKLLSSMNALYVTPGPFSIFRTKVFAEIGGYRHAHHTEDMEMALRLQKKGYRIANSPRAYVYTVGPAKLKGLYKQRVRWVYGFLNNALDYRELFFNKRYGNIGMFILPMATFSIFTTLYATGSFLYSLFGTASEQVAKYEAIGLSFGMPSFALGSIDWFAFNIGMIFWLAVVVFSLTLAILYLSLKLANGKFKLGKDIFYYLTLYIFIVPLWLAKATYSTITRRNITWR